jgi:hypothetical protein
MVVAPDSFVGVRYWEERYPDFESFIHGVAEMADALPGVSFALSDGDVVQWRLGMSGDVPLLFILNGGPAADIEIRFDQVPGGDRASVSDITTGECHQMDGNVLRLHLSDGGYHVLKFDPPS